jgi:lysophospholipase L1-like esterase
MCDGDKFCWYLGGNLAGQAIYVDGRPVAATPYATGAAMQFQTMLFPSAKARLIEIRTSAAIAAVYTQKPYQLWKPPPRRGPRVVIIGDSYAAGSGVTTSLNGMYYDIGPHIGSEDVWLDAQGGSGYGVHSTTNGTDVPAGGPNRYLDRITKVISAQTWDLAQIAPDLVVVHGGGANDKYKGRTDAQVIADVTAMFIKLRAKLPDARLVFVEGFAPPLAGFAANNPNYIAIRTAVQTALAGVGVYYIDVATTSPWIAGTGRIGATTGIGNSDVYIGNDYTHPVDAGHLYLRRRIAEKLRRILLDDGTLLNQMI